MGAGFYDAGRAPDLDHDPTKQIQWEIQRLAREVGEALTGGIQSLVDAAKEAVEETIKQVIDTIVGFITDPLSMFDDLTDWLADVPRLISGFLSSLVIPGLDASKIISGIFGTPLIPGLDVSKIISGIFGSGFIPGLDASKIITGIFGTGQIPGLDVSKIISGIFGSGFIPGLDASKITTGTFTLSQLPGTVLSTVSGVAASLVSGILNVLNIPALDAAKVTTGTFGTGLIPNLDAAKITTGIFGTGLIPGLDVSKIISGIFGTGFIPGLDASKITTGAFTLSQLPATVLSTVSGVAASLVSGLLGTSNIPALDASKVTTGTFGITQIPVASLNRTNITDLQSTIDSVVNYLGSNTGSSSNAISLAQQVMTNLRQSVVFTSQQVAELQTQASGAGNNGTQVDVPFAKYADGAFPSDFTVSYTGSGTSSHVISGGEAAATLVNDADRAWNVIWANNNFLSDYQSAYVTFDTGPYAAFGQTAATEIRLRENSGGTSYVWLRIENSGAWVYQYSMGYCVSGTRTTWISPTAFAAASTIRFYAGTPGGLRQYQIKAGNNLIRTYTEVGTSSQVGVAGGYVKGGYFQQMRQSGGGAVTPGTLVGFGMADTAATTYGSFARVVRSSTSGAASSINDRVLPNSLFDATPQRISADITYTQASNRFTVSKSQPYIFRFGCKFTATAVSQMIEPLCYIDTGSGLAIAERGDAQTWGSAAQNRYAAMFTVYLNAGESIAPGCNFTGSSPTYVGESTGTATYMSLVAAGGNS